MVLYRKVEIPDTQVATPDQVLAGTDLAELDPKTLPDSEASDRKYVLESEIDGEGSFALIEQLRKKSDLPLEWKAMRCVIELREEFLVAGGNPAAFGQFVQDFAAEGGEDALEGLRAMVKDEHVTQYLMIEGDDVFIGQQGNKKVEDLFRTTELLLQDGIDNVVMQAEQLIARETTRLEKLVSGNGYEEVPMSIRDAEATRCRARIKRLGGAL